MMAKRAALMAALLVLCSQLLPATAGTFRGRLVRGANAGPHWIYVQSRNGFLRKVEISAARVVFDQTVPKEQRGKAPNDALQEGAEVRVTAEQDAAGEWRASKVEILKPAEPIIEQESPRQPIAVFLS